MKKQTAVEWLVDQLTDELHEAYHPVLAKLYEQAKEMERKQIIDACYEFAFRILVEDGELLYTKIPEEIYKETYGDESN